MKTHFYTARKVSGSFKILCTGKWERPSPELERETYGGRTSPLEFTTVPGRVTCSECLKILIPRREAELHRMKAALNGVG